MITLSAGTHVNFTVQERHSGKRFWYEASGMITVEQTIDAKTAKSELQNYWAEEWEMPFDQIKITKFEICAA